MKKLNYGLYILFVLVILTSIVTSNRCCDAEVVKIHGHYPVSSKGEYCLRPTPSELPHNPLYKSWCQRNFNNGSALYEAYREIAFNIKYIPEPPKTDLWQTPFETMQTRAGDCEDAILLFHHLLPHYNYNGEIIWGIVEDFNKNIRFAHVWFQLYDKQGNAYIVEPFSGDWNGIIPIKSLREKEMRRRIVGISNRYISDIMRAPYLHERIKKLIVKQVIMFDWRLISQIDDVFAKLTQVSQRYLQQKHR